MSQIVVSTARTGTFRSIEQAIAATGTTDGTPVIVIEPGEYRLGDCLNYAGELELRAAAPGTVTMDCSAENLAFVEGTLTLRDLHLRHDHATGATVMVSGGKLTVDGCEIVGRSGLAASAVNGGTLNMKSTKVFDGVITFAGANGRVDGCETQGSPECGIRLESGSRVTVRNTAIRAAADHGVHVTSGSHGLIDGCLVGKSGGAGILVQHGAKTDIRATQLSEVGRSAIVAVDRAIVRIASGRVEGAAVSGLWVSGHSSVTAHKLWIDQAREDGTRVGRSSRLEMHDCRISASGGPGLVVESDGSVELVGTTLAECEVGMHVESTGTGTLDRSRLVRHRGPGLIVEAGGHVSARDSKISDNEGSGILLAQRGGLADERLRSIGNGAPDELGEPEPVQVTVAAEPAAVAIPEPEPEPAPEPEPEPTPIERAVPVPEVAVPALLDDLDRMIGLMKVKRDLTTLVSVVRASRRRAALGMPVGPTPARHLAFAGPPGTGKTTVGRLYGRILAAVGAMPTDKLTEVSRADLVGEALGETTHKTTAVVKRALGGVLFIDEAHTLARQFGVGADFGKEAIDALVKLMEDHRDELVVILAGYPAGLDEMLDANPGLRSRVGRTIHFEHYSPRELVSITEIMAADHRIRFAPDSSAALASHFGQLSRDASFGNARIARSVFERALEQQAVRLAMVDEPTAEQLSVITLDDLTGVVDPGLTARFGEIRDPDHVRRVIDRLTSMTGLNQVKHRISDVVALIEAAKLRRAEGLETEAVFANLIFSGGPGTGKTTVARMYGELLASLGILATGQVIEASRVDLVGQHLGETAAKTAAKFAQARGGVLFIDEAYALARRSGAGYGFGQEAIDTLVKLMEDHREEVVVIAAGYPDEMSDFVATNPGLASRFSDVVVFETYTPQEMTEILVWMVESSNYVLAADSRAAALAHIAEHEDVYAAGNGRAVRRLFDTMKTAHARRVAALRDAGRSLDRQDLSELLAVDLPSDVARSAV
ncbi:AAA family ATPase [Stackebrandtia soli]|uniref:AAA family ATPase n=1 Tax=Stackebrandtia soli TaxID=1892856 RepID=UPI0039E985A0